MPFRRRIRRRTIGKDARRMSRTLIQTLTAGSVQQVVVMQPTDQVGSSGTADIFENADTLNKVTPNSVCKYINIREELSIKPDIAAAQPGFYEYALVYFDEQQSDPTVDSQISTNVGTQTIGDLCVNLYRGKCVWNGSLAIAKEQPQVLDLKVKIPPRFCKSVRGAYWILIHFFRSAVTTDTTSQMSAVYSHQYKQYI